MLEGGFSQIFVMRYRTLPDSLNKEGGVEKRSVQEVPSALRLSSRLPVKTTQTKIITIQAFINNNNNNKRHLKYALLRKLNHSAYKNK